MRSLDAGDTPKSAAVADLNGDGLDDLIAGNFVATLSIYIGNRRSGLSAQRLKRILVSIENMVAAGQISVITNQGQSSLQPTFEFEYRQRSQADCCCGF